MVPGLIVFSHQTKCFRVQSESGQDLLLLGDLGSVDLLHIRAELLRSIMSRQTETRLKHIPVLEEKRKKKTTSKQTNKQLQSIQMWKWFPVRLSEDCHLAPHRWRNPCVQLRSLPFPNCHGIEVYLREFTSMQQSTSFWKLPVDSFYFFLSITFNCEIQCFHASKLQTFWLVICLCAAKKKKEKEKPRRIQIPLTQGNQWPSCKFKINTTRQSDILMAKL